MIFANDLILGDPRAVSVGEGKSKSWEEIGEEKKKKSRGSLMLGNVMKQYLMLDIILES